MEKVLIVGLIALPLVMFLALFATNITDTTKDRASPARNAAEQLLGKVTD